MSAESVRLWREANPERNTENNRKWRALNPDKVRAAKKKWHDGLGPEYMRAYRAQHAGRLAEATHRWRATHPEAVQAAQVRSRERRRAWKAGLKSGPCTDCGNAFPPECMDFDHVRGEKVQGVSCMSGIAALAEIEKCDLVCANCHRIRTRERKMAHRTEEGW